MVEEDGREGEAEHVANIDGCVGCTEIWAYLSQQREESDASD